MDEFSIFVFSLAGCVFAASAAAKLRSRRAYRSFRDGLHETGLVPERMLPAATASLAVTEAVVAAGLLAAAGAASPATLPGIPALALAVLLTAALATGIAMVIRRGTQARCACFGTRAGRPLGRVHLARNLSLLAVTCAGLAAAPLAHSRPPLAGTVLAAMAGAVAALLFIRWDDLAELFVPISRSMAAASTARQPAGRDR